MGDNSGIYAQRALYKQPHDLLPGDGNGVEVPEDVGLS